MISFRPSIAAQCNTALEEWGHYLGPQKGPRMVLWYAVYVGSELASVAVSAAPRGATCAGHDWREVVELARLCSAPDHRDMTRVCLRCWRKVAAQHWADRYHKTIRILAAYSDSTRHPGNIYRFDGWRLHDEKLRGGGGQTCGRLPQTVAPKKLWVYELAEPAMTKQLSWEATQ